MFHVPEDSRITIGPMASNASAENNGAFRLAPLIAGRSVWVIASDGLGWEHVSVHIGNGRGKTFMPTWDEMCHVKNIFWDAEDAVMQLHPPQSEWINNHPHVLHLWRPLTAIIPLPPPLAVGVKGAKIRVYADF